MGPGDHDEAAEWHRVAEERRRQLERIQGQPLYTAAAAALARGRRAAHLLRRTATPARDLGVRVARSAVAAPRRLGAAGRERALRDTVAALPPAPDGAARRGDVTAVIVTAAQPERLDTLLAALGRLDVQVLVVDNAGVADTATVVARHPNARRLRLDVPASYAAANEHALREVATAWTLLLNDDVAPLDEHWLDRMLVVAETGTVAVGAQLVHGRRGPLGGDAVDLTVQHAGIGFVLDGPIARPVHLDRGATPRPTVGARDVLAATAACLLVRTDAHRAVGGFHPGFDYGSEDVDLCLRLADHGAVRVATGAVLLHEEGATRLAGGDRRARGARQAANRALLDARHAPQLRRRVVDGAFGPTPEGLRVVVTTAGPAPEPLRAALHALPGVRLRAEGPAALTVVTDPRRATADRPTDDGPRIGWIDTAGGTWTGAALDALDALLLVGRGVTAPAVAPPTLPVRQVEDPADLPTILADLLRAPRWTLRTGAPGGRAAARWGDTPVAGALASELRAHGLVVRTLGRDGWGGPADRGADVTVHLKGRGVAPVADGQVNVVWVLSHPSEVAPGELDAADLVVAGSTLLAERYTGRTGTRVAVLPQAADGRRFTAGPVDPDLTSRVLFVGNTRAVPRPAVLGALDDGLPLTLVGAGWERFVDPRRVASDHVPYDALPGWYRAADVVLNDHWDDMARWGLVSNRVFDVLACGGCVVSDDVPGMADLVDGAVITFTDRDDVGSVVRAALADPEGRAARAARGRAAVLARHTWERRAAELVTLVAEVGG